MQRDFETLSIGSGFVSSFSRRRTIGRIKHKGEAVSDESHAKTGSRYFISIPTHETSAICLYVHIGSK